MHDLPHPLTRRQMLRQCALGFGNLAALDLLSRSASAAAAGGDPGTTLDARPPYFQPRARRIIFLFMHGGPSHVDTFDFKPRLITDHGKPLPFAKPRIQFAQTNNLGRSPWEFRCYGQSGAMVSDLFPHVGSCADDICFLKSIHGTNEAHGGALLKLHTGSDTFVRPSMGSWISYGLGTENRNLPSFITISPTWGHGGVANWSAAFLPGVHQGTPIGKRETPVKDSGIRYLHHPDTTPALQRAQLDLLRSLHQDHKKHSGADAVLDARLESFELAFRMQTEVPDIFDLQNESAATRKLYGIEEQPTDNFGRQCLLARRFAERGVRFIQVTHGYWDQHSDLTRDHAKLAREVDRPIAGLLRDLKSRGLLEDTLVLWGGEFGRTPTLQGQDGRDHHPHAFTMWLAGGGIRAGTSYGVTDDYGFYLQDEAVHVHDLHATLLALLGLDHEKLTFRYAGRDFRLTDIHGEVVSAVFA